MKRIRQKEGNDIIKGFAIAGFALMVVLGMGSMAAAIEDGVYDFYGALSMDGYYADGAGKACAMTDAGHTCPTTTDFCIKNLDVTSNVITSIDTGPHYGIAAAKVTGGLLPIDMDGVGPVSLTVDDTGNADLIWTMVVGESGGSCAGVNAAAMCVTSLSTNRQAPAGGSGTVIGAIPVVEASFPPTYPSCTGGEQAYPSYDDTTETATAIISNENGSNQTIEESGARLSGSTPPYTLELVDSTSTYRTMIGPIPLGTDLFAIAKWSGTLCKRSSARYVLRAWRVHLPG